MKPDVTLVAITAADAPLRLKATNYPEPFSPRAADREKRPARRSCSVSKNFGVNLTRLHPGGVSALRHAHTKHTDDA